MYKITLINDGEGTVIHSPYFNDLKVQAGQINHAINVADGFTISILPNNPGYNLIRPLKTLIQVFNMKTNELEFDGRILMPTESMDDSGKFAKSFVCESELGYLNDSCQRHGEYHDMTIKQFFEVMIANHNADVKDDDIDKKFVVGEVTVTNSTDNVYRYLGYESTFDSIDDKLISRLGGELRIRKENGIRYLDYLDLAGSTKQTEIRLSKNLKSMEIEVDPLEIITRLIPLGATIESEDEEATDASQARITIESVNGGKDYIEDEEAKKAFGVVTKSQNWDDINQPGILKTRGQQFLKENNKVKTKYVMSALDLSLIGLDTESFDVGNYYPVTNPVMNIFNEYLRVIEKTTDIINPNNNDLTFGDKFKTTAQYQHEANKSKQNIVNLESTVTRQSRRVSELSKATKEAQEEIIILQDLINNIDAESIEESLALMAQQLIAISEAVNDIGYEVMGLDLRTSLLEEFKVAQDLINHENNLLKDEQELINIDFEARIYNLENPVEGGT